MRCALLVRSVFHFCQRVARAAFGPALAFGLALTAPAATELWVAPDGAERNAGTREAPLDSLATALRTVRELRRTHAEKISGGVRIIMRGGTYALSEPVFIRPEDSGTAESPTRIVAPDGEYPRLSGGVAIASWEKLSSADAATAADGRLPLVARAKVWVADAPVFNGRALNFRQLWIGDRKATRARTPNDGDMIRLTAWDKERREAGVPAATVQNLKTPAGAELVLLQMWEVAVLRVKTIRVAGDEARLTFHSPESRVQFEHPWPPPVMKPEGNSPFFLANAPEFLDAPGEWWLDERAGRVYYWPRDGETPATASAIVPALETLVEIAGTPETSVQHVAFAGLAFAHTTWLRPTTHGHVPLQAGMYLIDAYRLNPKGTPDWRSLDNQGWTQSPPAGVQVTFARDVSFARCQFAQLAASGLELGLGVQAATVEGCTFADIGINGIQAGFFGTGGLETHLPWQPRDERVIPARLRIANNFLTDTANEDWGGVAITAGFTRDTAIEHNEIAATSYTAISVGWGWTRTTNASQQNRIHANRIGRFATRLADTAGIYLLSAQPGTVVSENVIEAPVMSPWVHDPKHWGYVYLDEGSAFITVRDNWSPEEKFIKNANGPGNDWRYNGPLVSEKIKAAAGLEPEFKRGLKTGAAAAAIAPAPAAAK